MTMITQTALKPKPATEHHSTCESCPYFTDFNDKRGRGWCRVFDLFARKHHQKTETCISSINILEKEEKPAFEVWVKLYSQEIEDDGYGQPVPVDEKLVEVFVSRPTRALVEAAIALRNDLHGYQIVNFWQPEGDFEL